MSFSTAKYITLSDKQWPILTGGLITNSEPWMIPYKNTPNAQNFRVNGRWISIREGFYQFWDILGATGHPMGIAAYYRSIPTDDSIILRYNSDSTHKLVSVHPTTWVQTEIDTGTNIASDNRMNFVGANDSLYCLNGSDRIWKISWTSYSTISTGSIDFQWTGINDMTVTYWVVWHIFNIVIYSAASSPDQFAWNVDGWAYTFWVGITWGAQLLAYWTSVTFFDVNWHTQDDVWIVNTWFLASFGTWFDNSLFIAGDPARPNRLYKSAANSPDSYTGSGSDIFDSPYPISWLAWAGQTLYVFSRNTIDMINNNSIKQVGDILAYTSIPLEANEGASNHESIAVYWKDCYYLSASNKIKKLTPNSQLFYDVAEVSHRTGKGIDRTMERLDKDQSQSFAYVIPEKGLIKWHVKSKGSSFNDICIVYSVIYDEFMLDTKKTFLAWINYNTKNYTISQIEPKLYRDEEWYTDDDTPIQFIYETKALDLWEPTILKEMWQARTFLWINSLAVVSQDIFKDWQLVDTKTIDKDDLPYDIDWIGTQEIWTFAIWEEADLTKVSDLINISVVRDKWNLQQRWQVFNVRWSCSTLWARVNLQQFTPRMELLSQLTASTQ